MWYVTLILTNHYAIVTTTTLYKNNDNIGSKWFNKSNSNNNKSVGIYLQKTKKPKHISLCYCARAMFGLCFRQITKAGLIAIFVYHVSHLPITYFILKNPLPTMMRYWWLR